MKINGSLVFDASSASEIQNLRVQKFTGALVPAWTSADAGRLVFVTETGGGYTVGTILYGTTTAWVALATGGNAAALQIEVDAIETSLGAIVNSSGVFVPGQMVIGGVTSTATTLTGMLQELAAYATGKDALAELNDVNVTGVTDGQFLRYNTGTSKWEDATIVVGDIPSLTVSAAQINNVAATTATTTELNYVSGVTSSIQTQLSNKQPLDAGLTSLAALAGTGIIVQTADNVFTARTLVAPAAGVTITDPAGIAGNPTFALANDLAALEGLATTGYIVRTGDGTATTRSIVGTSGNIVVTNGSGVGSDTSLNLDTVTQAATGNFVKVTLDTFGRVTGNTAVVTADITALVDTTYVNVAGDSMSSAANLTFSGGGTVLGLPTPTNDTDAANKAYVDALTAGLSWKQAVRAASTTNVVIATALENTDVLDGVTLATGDRVLVKDQTTSSENGIYVVQATGAAVRATDMNQAAEFDGAAVFVKEGTVNQGSGWTETATVTTVGTDAVVFSQFTGGALYTWGVGLSNDGNTINVNLGAGIAQLPSDEVGIDLFNTTTGAIILTDDGTTRAGSPATNSKLHLLLDTASTGGLNQGSLGLFIKAAGVTNAMLVNQGFVTNADSGTNGALNLGGELEIAGSSVQGITTAIAGSVFTISAANASDTQKGVATFNTGDFLVTAGDVTIKAAGVDNVQLVNSTITVTGTTGTDAVALGESLAFVGGAGGEVSTAMGTNSLAISVRDATASLKGVASFDAADFTVTSGAVTAVAKNLDSLTDVVITSAAGGQALVYNGTNFVNRKVFHTGAFASSTTWVVTHGLGQKFCNVTIADALDEVVIPQSITFNSTTQLTVTFNTAIAGQVMVSGINPGA